eukprot:gene1221-1542_t
MGSQQQAIMGIDFGTHYACVGVIKNDRVEICPNQQGNRTTPSVVSFVGSDKLVGDEAKSQMDRNPQNTIYDVKKLIGKKTNDQSFINDIKKLPYTIITSEKNVDSINFEVSFNSKTYQPTPIEITSNILSQIKHTAETFLGEPIKKAVITVPFDFTEKQRKDLKDAAQSAGIHVIRLIHEHSAVALAYGYDQQQQQQSPSTSTTTKEDENILIFDLGGCGLSVSMVSVKNQLFEIIGNVTDHSLSGEAFDQVLVQHFIQEFKRKYKCDLTESKRSVAKLKTYCEKAKRNLSNMTQASLEIDSLFEGMDLFTSITRARFEDLASDLIKGCSRSIATLLEKCGPSFTKESVDKIILVGGGSRIPAVQNLVSDYFNKKELTKTMNQEEVVCFGATLQAKYLTDQQTGGSSAQEKKFMAGHHYSLPVVPQSVGLEDANTGNMVPVIPAGTRIPCKRSFKITNQSDQQSSINLSVYQGSSTVAKENQLISRLICNIEPSPKQTLQIEVSFEFDKNGLLTITTPESSYQISPTTKK